MHIQEAEKKRIPSNGKSIRAKIQARARTTSIDRGRSKCTFAMLMLSAGKLAFKVQKKKELKGAKNES